MENMTSEKLQVCLLSRVGSRAYNFATPESDDDQRGFGLQTHIFRVLGLQRPRDEESNVVDGYLWDVSKFTRLAVKANTNALDTLFAEDFNVLEINDVGRLYREYRKEFLSTHALYNVLKGYALSELDLATGRKKPGDMGAKRRTLVERYGYCGKNMHHCCRLLMAGTYAFQRGNFKTHWYTDTDDWKILMGLKMNDLSLEAVLMLHCKCMRDFERAAKESVLPDEPDLDLINELLCYVVGREVVKEFPSLRFAKGD